MEQGTMMLAAIDAMADAHTIWTPRGDKPNSTAQTTTRETIHLGLLR
ncbi:hypothetical protein CEV31_2793 [Brucella thiophenivorans]|uniref:Uncharacterized protein n=1 Tax=Brucella thiophenivorans TaxID=571255 RepID=A0A256FIZ0_9HYPH|nr:hypothetical protein CEV31_2793 [Brucella thiophenivorans]